MGSRPSWPNVDQKQRELGEMGKDQQGFPGVLYLLQGSQASPQGIVFSQKPFHLFLCICTLDGYLDPAPQQGRVGPEQEDRTYLQPRKKIRSTHVRAHTHCSHSFNANSPSPFSTMYLILQCPQSCCMLQPLPLPLIS